MKTVAMIAVPGGMAITGAMRWLGEHLSSDAIAMALGMVLGVVAVIPTALLVLAARRRDEADDWNDQPVQVYGLLNSDHVNLRGGGFDGVYLRAPAEWPEVQAEQGEHQIVRVQR